MWRESSTGWGQDIDYAISFQDASGCFAVWEYICNVRDNYRPEDQFYDDQSPQQERGHGHAAKNSNRYQSFSLPSVTVENLPDIIDRFTAAANNGQQKRTVSHYIIENVSRPHLLTTLVQSN